MTAQGVNPMPDKLQAIRDWPTPHCLRDVRAFFGLASYYRRFVRNFASIAEPLTRLTKKNNTPFKWTDDADHGSVHNLDVQLYKINIIYNYVICLLERLLAVAFTLYCYL